MTEDINTIMAKGHVWIQCQWSAKTDGPTSDDSVTIPEEHRRCSKWYPGREADREDQRRSKYDFSINFISNHYLRGDFLCEGSQTGAGNCN